MIISLSPMRVIPESKTVLAAEKLVIKIIMI